MTRDGADNMVTEEQILDALSSVRDPELDEPITTLRFVESLEVAGNGVRVALRLPTYFCAPNFAYLMAADAADAVRNVPGVTRAEVVLQDHFASDEINQGLQSGLDFSQTFPGEAGADLSPLRSLFERKGFVARQERICRKLIRGGTSVRGLARMRLHDLPDTKEVAAYLKRRRDLGIDTSRDAPFVVTAAGVPVREAELDDHLRFARAVKVSIEANATLCRSLLATRYGIPDPEEVTDESSQVAQLPRATRAG